jgi:hypothetical protein
MMTCFSVIATWHEALDSYETLPCTRIVPGHGAPGGKELCGGFAPTAERTVGPARMIVEELDTQTRN